jgi:peptide/nickel transport system substrate-binding protein/oligopeptide transport system substrate-binding protein
MINLRLKAVRRYSAKARLIALLLLLLPMVLAACDLGGTNPTPTPAAGPQATDTPGVSEGLPTAEPTQPGDVVAPGAGGVLRWSNEGVSELDTLDPPRSQSSNSVMAITLIFEGLVRLDSKLNIEAAGAEKWEISDDGKTYTFTIRKDLKFADGSPVTSEDFRWSLERALSKEMASGSATYYLSNIEGAKEWNEGTATSLTGVTAPNPETLVIQIKQPGVYFLDQLTYAGGFVVPRKLIEEKGEKWIDEAWGTGPFMVQEWQHNQSLTLVPNPNYWKGKSVLERIEMPFVQNPETAYQLYQTGELDIMGSQQFPPAQVAATQGTPGFKQVPQFFVAYIGFNNAKTPLDNITLRRALALTIDKQTLAERVLAGAVLATDHIVPQGMPGYHEGLETLSFDPDKAKAELAAAGIPAASGLKLSYTTGQADFDKVAATVQQMWKQHLGIDVELDGEEQGKFNDDLTAMAADPAKSEMQMYISVWGADYPDPQNFLTQQLHTGVGNNNGHWSDPEFDRLTEQADVERDFGTRMSLYNQAEQIAIDKVGWLPLYNGTGNVLIRPTVKGITYTAQGLFSDDWSKVTVGE